MPKRIKLRGKSQRRTDSGPYPLGEFPASVAVEMGRHIVHRLAVGHADITGDDFGGIFAAAINGQHKGKPLGIADVAWDGCAWSVKTVKDNHPFKQTRIRVISGRNSPTYSSDIKDFFINKRPAMLQENDVLKAVNFEESWIEHVTEKGELCI